MPDTLHSRSARSICHAPRAAIGMPAWTDAWLRHFRLLVHRKAGCAATWMRRRRNAHADPPPQARLV
ncbi:hypothetical protein ACFOPN_15065 [Xanthomonas hyacinthi]|uniref:hypothetical protein n=1 Tax=Xanthomonas hyacinthi TaxID=56455 RepID=UPI00361F8724